MARVLLFKETLLPPSETFIEAQARALTRYEYRLVGLERSAKSLPLRDPLLLSQRHGRMASLRAKLYRRTGWAPGFHRQAAAFHPQLLHAHFASGGRSALSLARQLEVPLLVTLHGADITVHGAAQRYGELARTAAGFLCVSHFIRERALAAGLPEEKLKVHSIGIDCDSFTTAAGAATAPSVMFVGRLVEKKGCEYLVRAMARVQQDYPEAHLVILGDGPLRGHLEALARTLSVECTFLGLQPSTVVREHLRKARVFCAPSVTAANGDSEGLGMVFAEAQALGVPVVSTRHGGIPEVVEDGRTGLLVPERDADALAAAIIRLLGDPVLHNAFAQAAVTHIRRNFNLATQTALLEDIYDRVREHRAF